MCKAIIGCMIGILVLSQVATCADITAGIPVKYVSGCEVDLNKDGKLDVSLLIETFDGQELIVLMQGQDGYKAYKVTSYKSNVSMTLSCHYAKTLTSTSAGEGEGKEKVYQVSGMYLKLAQAEGASVAYFWSGKGFTEVWLSD